MSFGSTWMRSVAAGRAEAAGQGGQGAGDDAAVPSRRVRWRSCVRIVPTRFPTVHLFERIAPAADFDALNAIESLTNERLRDETGDIRSVPEVDRVGGPGASYVMAPFAHASPIGGRFTAPGQGAWYGAKGRETAIRETIYHRERFLSATNEPSIDLEMRVIEADLDGTLHDIRALLDERPDLYDPDNYGASQRFGEAHRAAGSNGIVFRSVRHEGGECVAVFRPRLLRNARQGDHLLYRWNGERIADVLRLTHRMI
jgi:RES domain-containing protein